MTINNGTWLITGGCGFIGTNLIETLLKDNPQANIRVLDNLSVGQEQDLQEVCNFRFVPPSSLVEGPSGVELVVGDVRDINVMLAACKGINVVIHLAANTGVAPSVEDPRNDCEVNVLGILNTLEAARHNGVNKFLFASSGAPLGEQNPPIHEEKVPHPVSPYGASKLAGEGYCSAYYHTFGVPTVVLRFSNVYGPLSKYKNSIVAKFIKNALRGEVLEVYGDGQQTRDFIYVKDLVNAITLAVGHGLVGNVYQIATFRETTINELTDKIVILIGERMPDLNVKVRYGAKRVGDIRRNYSDTSKAQKDLGFFPKYSLEQGLNETIDWFLRTL